jgi:hypothetical protein
MSGSYDRPTGAPTRGLELDPYRDRTGPATVTQGRGTQEQTRPAARPAADERASRSRRNEPGQTNAPIVPAGSVTGR